MLIFFLPFLIAACVLDEMQKSPHPFYTIALNIISFTSVTILEKNRSFLNQQMYLFGSIVLLQNGRVERVRVGKFHHAVRACCVGKILQEEVMALWVSGETLR